MIPLIFSLLFCLLFGISAVESSSLQQDNVSGVDQLCPVCSSLIFNETCPDCIAESAARITFQMGKLDGGFGRDSTCSYTINCPPPSTIEFQLYGGFVYKGAPSTGPILFCDQEGPNTGVWYTGIPPRTTSMQVLSVKCRAGCSGK